MKKLLVINLARISAGILLVAQTIGLTCCANQAKQGNVPPILLLATQNHFGYYTEQILLTEGFNEYEIDSIGSNRINADHLNQFDVVILAQTSVTDAHLELLKDYVNDGGCLIAFRPDQKLSPVFGVSEFSGAIHDGYISLNEDSQVGEGITRETLQFHGTADQYKLQTGKAVASLYDDKERRTEFPAIVSNALGNGRAFAFLYNLPESIVLTRQGNPEHAGMEQDGITGIRAMDYFTGGWVDTTKNTINQADQQMHLLTRCIEDAYEIAKPLPRFWYFPDSLKCLVTLNNDGEDSREDEFTPQFEAVDAKGARMTLYIKETELVSKEWVDKWVQKGFEIAAHPDDTRQATAPDWGTMDSVIKNIKDQLNTKYGIPGIYTNTNHWFLWVGKDAGGKPDFTAMAKIEELNNIGLDCNYAHYDNGSTHGHYFGAMGTNQGNYTGSGLAMKFADADGRIIDVYQQLNNVYDQQYMEHDDKDGYFNAFKGLMDRSLEDEVYSLISVKAHNNEYYYFSKEPLMRILDYANEKQVPVWTQVNLLEFLRAKDEARFSDVVWEDNVLRFAVRSSLTHANGITFMVPASHNGRSVKRILMDNTEYALRIDTILGRPYAMVTVQPGADYQFQVSY
ncbi:MAG TPA: hypothetical protein VKZ75_10510 [Cyclobacteriaceae bacterium]|nr:hypothetical protein [Cyclobacteriaceae bacterium]